MQTDIPAVTGLICPSTAGKPLRVVFHVFCNKNSDAPGYFLSFRTWLRPCCSKTIYRCIDVWPSFTHFVAGVCRSLLLWCRFKWHIIFKVFDIVYGSLVLQCLQTVFVCNFFTIVLYRDRKPKILPDVGLMRRRGIFNFSFRRTHVALLMFSSSNFCNCDESTE